MQFLNQVPAQADLNDISTDIIQDSQSALYVVDDNISRVNRSLPPCNIGHFWFSLL